MNSRTLEAQCATRTDAVPVPTLSYGVQKSKSGVWFVTATWLFLALAMTGTAFDFVVWLDFGNPWDVKNLWTCGLLFLAVVTGVFGLYRKVGGEYVGSALLLGAIIALPLLVLSGRMALIQLIYGPEPDIRIQNQCRMRQANLFYTIQVYADAHGGSYPATLENLLPSDYITPMDLYCPATPGPGVSPRYRYFGGGLKTPCPPRKIILAEEPHNHGRLGFHIVRGDSSIEYVEGSRAEKILRSLKDGKSPVGD